MIVRIWHGVTPAAKSEEYFDYLRAMEGNRDVYVLRRIEGDRAHFLTVEEISTVDGAGGDEGREGVMNVLNALGKLPDRQRVAVTLRYLQDLPYAEISGITGWPEGTVKTLVHRGLVRLRNQMIIGDSKGGDPA
jgi:RNA polymerase sigma factor (sigma-70 family)